MAAEMAARAIQLILAPVVMISACALLLNGLLARYAAINDRLRSMAHERFELWRALGEQPADGPDRRAALERLSDIDIQAPVVLGHHRLLRNASLIAYCAVLLFIACMVFIAVEVMTAANWLANAGLGLFLGGTVALLVCAGIAAREVSTSHLAVRYEMLRVLRLPPLGPAAPPTAAPASRDATTTTADQPS